MYTFKIYKLKICTCLILFISTFELLPAFFQISRSNFFLSFPHLLLMGFWMLNTTQVHLMRNVCLGARTIQSLHRGPRHSLDRDILSHIYIDRICGLSWGRHDSPILLLVGGIVRPFDKRKPLTKSLAFIMVLVD